MSKGRAGRKKKRWRSLRGLWTIASTISPGRSLLVLFCLTIAGTAEGLGIASLLPLLSVIGQDGHVTGTSRAILHAFDSVGLTLNLNTLLVILVAGMSLKSVLTLAAMHQVGHAVAEVSMKMRLGLIRGLLDARWNFFVRQPIGRFTSALGGESSQAGETYNGLAQFLSNVIQALIYLTVAAMVSWELAALSLAVGLFMVMSLNRLVISAKRTAKMQAKRTRSMISRLTDVLAGLKPMKAMGRQARFGALFTRDIGEINTSIRRQVFAKHANKALQDPIIAVCLAIGIYAALTLWKMPVGEVLVMALLLARTVSVIGKAQQDLQNLRTTENGFWAVSDLIKETRKQREVAEGTLTPDFHDGLRFEDVSFSFGPKVILDHASFTIPAGEVTAITGPSGTGKTTLVDIMLGLHQPEGGEVRIDGVPLNAIDLGKWRSMTGYVPQELMLFHDTILANVTLGEPDFSRADVEDALRRAGAWDFVAQLADGMETIAGERGSLLSGGQRQRIAIARALVHKPQLLIMDEATTALDPVTEARIVQGVCELSRATGLTVLSISHQAAWRNAADNVLELKNGAVVYGSAEEVRTAAR